MIVFLAAALIQSQTTGEIELGTNPAAIFIHWTPGMMMNPTFGEFEVAAWKSGKILWRDKPIEWKQGPKGWELTKGRYFRAEIDPTLISQSIQRLRQKGVFDKKSWSYVWVDSSFYAIQLWDNKQVVRIDCMGDPVGRSPGEPEEWVNIFRIWKMVREEARSLIPKKGTAIARPRVDEQLKWRLPYR